MRRAHPLAAALEFASALTLTVVLAAAPGCTSEPAPRPSAPPAASAQRSAPLPAAQPAPPAASAAPRAPARARRRYAVAALGDSITDGRVGGGGYLRLLRAACPKSRFEDFGRGGDMTNQMRRRFEQTILPRAREFTTLLVYGGVNDLYSDQTAGRTNERIEEDLGAIYADARRAGLEVVGVTVSPWGGFRRYFTPARSRSTRLLNAWILGGPAAGRLDAAVDSYPVLSCGDPEVLCPEYQGPTPDGLHPGPRGHELLGQLLLERAFADCE